MPGTTRLLHVSDARVAEDHPDDPLGGFGRVVARARELDVTAIVYTGNLINATSPDTALLDQFTAQFDALHDAEISLCYVEGRRDTVGGFNPWATEHLGDHPVLTHLDRTPTDIDDNFALFGIDHGFSTTLTNLLQASKTEFTPASGVSHQLLALSHPISPPIDRQAADAQAFEVATNINLYLDGILAGGTENTQTWTHDDSDFGVFYPGSINPIRCGTGGSPQGILYHSDDEDNLQWRSVPLDPAEPVQEITTLETLLAEYQEPDLADMETETLIDLYGLLAEASSKLDDRRKDVRDLLLERLPAGEHDTGEIARVYHQRTTSMQLRDDEAVLDAINRAGVAKDRITETVEEIDPDAVDAVVAEHPQLSADDVFEEQVREYIQKRDVTISDTEKP